MADDPAGPDNTAVRVALWRALHLELDPPPHVLVDDLGLQLAAPEAGWRARRDMDPVGTSRNRASIVGRARFVEDLVTEQADAGVAQYVVLGAGLDTCMQRHPELVDRIRVFEVDQPGTQAWKRRRLAEIGAEIPPSLHFVPVDFEAGESWDQQLGAAGFDAVEPAVVASTGVSVYLTETSISATLRHVAAFERGSTLVMSFMIPLDTVDADEQPALRGAERGARAGGTPWVSFFTPTAMVDLARAAGFREVRHVSPAALAERYFGHRPDGLRPSSAEHLVVATT